MIKRPIRSFGWLFSLVQYKLSAPFWVSLSIGEGLQLAADDDDSLLTSVRPVILLGDSIKFRLDFQLSCVLFS